MSCVVAEAAVVGPRFTLPPREHERPTGEEARTKACVAAEDACKSECSTDLLALIKSGHIC